MGIEDLVRDVRGICPECGQEMRYDRWPLLGGYVPPCDACADLRETTRAAAGAAPPRHRFAGRMPPAYRRSQSPLVPSCYREALSWKPETHRGGVGLIGPSGSGKSSAIACLALARDELFLWWSGAEARSIAIEAATADSGREAALRRWQSAMHVPILIVDDISQGVMTAAWTSRFFELLEIRLAHDRPTFWTCQMSLDDLRATMIRQNGNDKERAVALSRRLGLFSLILKGGAE